MIPALAALIPALTAAGGAGGAAGAAGAAGAMGGAGGLASAAGAAAPAMSKLGEQASPDTSGAPPVKAEQQAGADPAGGMEKLSGGMGAKGAMAGGMAKAGLDALFSFAAAKRKQTREKQQQLVSSVGDMQSRMLAQSNRTSQLMSNLKPLG